jgi:hypothetical protein
LNIPELFNTFSVFLDKSPLMGLLFELKHLLGDGHGLQHLIGKHLGGQQSIGGQHLGGQQLIGGQHLGGQHVIGGQHLGGQGSQHTGRHVGNSSNLVNSHKSTLPSQLESILFIIARTSLSK